MADLSLQHAGDTNAGKKRDHNEDCIAAEPGLGLWLVADGVGGHAAGEVASDLVRRTIIERVTAGDSLAAAITRSHEVLLAEIEQRGASSPLGMGSTVVAARIEGSDYEVAWVGDSRAYLFDGQLQQLSTDHTRVQELLAQGAITPEEAHSHPERHVLTQCLGVSKGVQLSPGRVSGTLKSGEQLLLCSDGLTDELSDSVITGLLARNHSPGAQVEALIRSALDMGGNDNVSVVVVGDFEVSKHDLETTHNRRRSSDASRSRRERFPFKVLALLTALCLAVLWLLQ
ncbi:MAG: serine/threonine-protein phosphatase [Halioglobus sp.]|nr:serine/threonine-protein phosphatase [Halioglobus sp.]